jgi:hypothetical protein
MPASGWSTEQGRYAISIYHTAADVGGQGLAPDTIWITGNRINRPVSCGIYAARGRNIAIEGNSINGQRDGLDGTEPKGAIALNHSDTMPAHPIMNNDLQDNLIGIGVAGGNVSVAQNSITVPANSYGMKLWADDETLFDIRDVTLSTAAVNAVSVVGVGAPGYPSALSVSQNGWAACGGGNPALRWYRDVPGGAALMSYAAMPNIHFGPIVANRLSQGAFWRPACN